MFVSTHPDTILRLGTKDVLVETRDLPFGSDVHRVDSLAQLEAELPARLRGGARVLKQVRGHSGIGVWRVERSEHDGPALTMRLRHAQRGSDEEIVDLPALLQRMAPYFEPAQGGHMIDQAWQPRLAEGMVRAYLVEDRVTGFGHQAINALVPARSGESAPQPGPRLYHGPDMPEFQALKRLLETQWVEQLRQRVGVARERLPLLWDCDFMLGERAPGSPSATCCARSTSAACRRFRRRRSDRWSRRRRRAWPESELVHASRGLIGITAEAACVGYAEGTAAIGCLDAVALHT